MEWFSELASWANANEGLIAMLIGIGGLLAFVVRQQVTAKAVAQAREPVPAKVVIRPIDEETSAVLTETLAGYGGRPEVSEGVLTAAFLDADDAARAALRALPAAAGPIEVLVLAQGAAVPGGAGREGQVLTTGTIRRALLDASDLEVRSSADPHLPFAIGETRGNAGVVRRWALPAAGVGLTLLGAVWFLSGPQPAEQPIRSIAVLPLQNLSGDPEQDYFADGVTEDLIGALSRIGELRVPSHRSVLRFKGTTEPLPDVAAELGVAALIEGSVRREGERVRITVQLVMGAADEHLWHESYDEDLRGILALQARIARAVAGRVKLTLAPSELERLAIDRWVVPSAYDAYLRARELDRVQKGWASPAIIEHLERAVALDAEFASARVWLADAYLSAPGFGHGPPHEFMPKARAQAIKALELGAIEANIPLAWIAILYDWDWAEASERFQRVRKAAPHSFYGGAAQLGQGSLLCIRGEWETGMQQMRAGAAMDPLYLPFRTTQLEFEARRRRYDAAIDGANALLAIDSNLSHAYIVAWMAHAWKGEWDESVSVWTRFMKVIGADPERLVQIYRQHGVRALTQARLEIDLKRRKTNYASAVRIAIWYLAHGDSDAAFAWLEKAYQERDPQLVYVFNLYPNFDPVRDDPRFAALAERVGLPLVAPDGPLAAPRPD